MIPVLCDKDVGDAMLVEEEEEDDEEEVVDDINDKDAMDDETWLRFPLFIVLLLSLLLLLLLFVFEFGRRSLHLSNSLACSNENFFSMIARRKKN